MKTILLLRHAKSDWDAQYGSDRERPLAKRGRNAAALMGRFLSRLGQVPDSVISSPAVRALDTAHRAADAGEWDCCLCTEEKLYEASISQVLDIIRGQADAQGTILLVGHEPTCSQLIGDLIGGGSARFPTAAIARIDMNIERWKDADFGGGTLMWLITPKLLKRNKS